jgi:hypothetical protein
LARKAFRAKAVHGATLQVQQTEAQGNPAGNGAFAGTRRAVNGDDRQALGLGGIGDVRRAAHPRFLAPEAPA